MHSVLLVYQFGNKEAILAAKSALKDAGFSVHLKDRSKLVPDSVKKADLIVTIGGDGTFLRASHSIRTDVPVLGLNADPKKKVGFFTRSDAGSIAGYALRLKKRDFKVRKLTRLRCVLQGVELPFLALNEFFLSHSISYKLSKYVLDGETQRSSGILIGTASGSHAWIKSAGGSVMPIESRRFQFVVREPYDGAGINATKIKGTLGKYSDLRVTSLMKNGIIVVDCLSRPYRINCYDEAVFSVSPHPLHMVDF